MAKTDYRFDNIHLDYDYEVFFEAVKKFCRREEVPFRVDSDFIDDRGFNLDLSRKSSFVANEASGKVHIVGYKSEATEDQAVEISVTTKNAETGEEETTVEKRTAGVDITIQCNSGELTREKCEDRVVNRILKGAERAIEGKSVEQMLAESRAQGTESMKELIGEGKEKRNFIITAIVALLIIAFAAPDACNHGWF